MRETQNWYEWTTSYKYYHQAKFDVCYIQCPRNHKFNVSVAREPEKYNNNTAI